MRILFLLFLTINIVCGGTVLSDKIALQKECVEFLRQESNKGFPRVTNIAKSFIIPNSELFTKNNSDKNEIKKYNLELWLICLRSCYALIESDFSDVDLSQKYLISDKRLSRQTQCKALLDFSEILASLIIERIEREFTNKEIEEDIIPLIMNGYSKKDENLPHGSINYFQHIISKLQEYIRKTGAIQKGGIGK